MNKLLRNINFGRASVLLQQRSYLESSLTSSDTSLSKLQGLLTNNRRWQSTAEIKKEGLKGPPTLGDEVVKVSENCAKRLTEIIREADGKNKFLRVTVEGGGCSGFQYKFLIDDKIMSDDTKFRHPESKYEKALVVVDPVSMEYLKGSTVDYHVELIRSAFRVVNNPKADHGCSCGASFTIKV